MRPAFEMHLGMAFLRLHALLLKVSFGKDWGVSDDPIAWASVAHS